MQSTVSHTIALISNPNCGKTTLFNALTGARQRVGNWSGVTVAQKSGICVTASHRFEIIDLPGIYSLDGISEQAALDEYIAYHCLLTQPLSFLINVIDVNHLARHLYLTTQLLEMGCPLLVVLNMMDVARASGLCVDVATLSSMLGVPVIPMVAHQRSDIQRFKQALCEYVNVLPSSSGVIENMRYPSAILKSIQVLSNDLALLSPAACVSTETSERVLKDVADPGARESKRACLEFVHLIQRWGPRWIAMRLLEDDHSIARVMPPPVRQRVKQEQHLIHQHAEEDADILIAHARYQWIEHVTQTCVQKTAVPLSRFSRWSSRLDTVLLHRWFGIPIFLGIMYVLFAFSIQIGGMLQGGLDAISQRIFVDDVAEVFSHWHAPSWSIAVFAYGLGKGISTILSFVPVLSLLFLFLALLEDSGYMMRAAFVVDRLMCALGLPGKAFVPMIVGFGCNVPAVMAARILENKRDRILAIMMSPFMSCGARLAIYTVFTTTFFRQNGQNIVFLLYLIGIVMAIITGWILRRTLLCGTPTPLIMELPAFHVPQWNNLRLHAWQRLRAFVIGAGRLILPICMLLGALNAIHVGNTVDAPSLLSLIGQWITPIFEPMGIRPENWPATVGLLTGVLAKEVVVGTLNTLYAQLHVVNTVLLPTLSMGQYDAVDHSAHIFQVMYTQFGGPIHAFAYLLFVLLYFPCVSTSAAIVRELHWGWALLSMGWMTGIAYGVAVLFYQSATWHMHPLSSVLWITGVISILIFILFGLRIYAIKERRHVSSELLRGSSKERCAGAKLEVSKTSEPVT